MNGIIYKAVCLVNGKIYIGQTVKCLKTRINRHTNAVQGVFPRALRTYGVEQFKFTIIDSSHDRNELNEKEIFWIQFYRSKSPAGYNLTDGGDGCSGYKQSREHTEKIRTANIGQVRTDESKTKMRNAQKGKKQSVEVIAKRVANNTGKKRTPEQKQRQSDSLNRSWAQRKFDPQGLFAF